MITLEDEPKPLYFTPYEAPILVTDYEAILYWDPELEQPNPGSRANDLVWYIREYLKRLKTMPLCNHVIAPVCVWNGL